MCKKVALITGITGQDGSYLAELLLDKGYEVHGIVRRSSSFNTGRIDHIYQDPHNSNKNLHLHYGDLSDSSNLYNIFSKVMPDELYNLAAMSHVRVSFDQPEYTANVDGIGVLRVLDCIKTMKPECRFYQASSSELFGIPYEVPQNELTRFHPRSPYGVAKLYGYAITVNYREAYGLHASNGILFNHECFDANTPIIIKKNDFIFVEYMRNLLPERKDMTKDNNVLTREINGVEIWNGNKFVKAKAITRRKMNTLDLVNRRKNIYNSRHGAVKVTPNHKLLDEDGNKKVASLFSNGEKLKHGVFPEPERKTVVLEEEAEFLGMLVGDGYVNEDNIRFTNLDDTLLSRCYNLANLIYGNVSYRKSEGPTEYGYSKCIDITGVGGNRIKALREEIYDYRSKHKKVPLRILNADNKTKIAFFRGYYACDGLKKDNCRYEFKSIKSNSPLLCQGLLLIMSGISNQDFNMNVFNQNGKEYYQINFNSDVDNDKGKHLKLDREELKKITDADEDTNCFVYDIETECGYLNAGVGTMVVGNSERRGETFVTRKISKAVASIKLGLQDCLYLGNIYSQRDWGYAKDFVEGMWLMLQQDQPDDYVLATGETHTIKEFVNLSFDLAGISLQWSGEGQNEIGVDKDNGRILVRIDPNYYRPSEVDLLLGDYSKAKNKLGWTPKVKFNELVKIMYEADYNDLKNK